MLAHHNYDNETLIFGVTEQYFAIPIDYPYLKFLMKI